MKTRKAKPGAPRQNKPATSPQKKYLPKPEESAAIQKAVEERKIAPAPRLKVENNVITIDHPDKVIGLLLMLNALGTLDREFMSGLLDQLAGATSRGSDVSETDLNFMVSVIKGIEPRDQLESMLAAQMAATHMAMLWFVRGLQRVENLPQQDAAERAINKFARTYVAQMEALKRYRSGGEQKVTVQHVSVSEGGQAIVGNVTQGQRDAPTNPTAAPPLAISDAKTVPMPIIESKERAHVREPRSSKKK
jgi:hypothetical protein